LRGDQNLQAGDATIEAKEMSQEHTGAAMGLIAGLYLWNGEFGQCIQWRGIWMNQNRKLSAWYSSSHGADYSMRSVWFRMAGGHPAGDQL